MIWNVLWIAVNALAVLGGWAILVAYYLCG